jgi:hypothetical protein
MAHDSGLTWHTRTVPSGDQQAIAAAELACGCATGIAVAAHVVEHEPRHPSPRVDPAPPLTTLLLDMRPCAGAEEDDTPELVAMLRDLAQPILHHSQAWFVVVREDTVVGSFHNPWDALVTARRLLDVARALGIRGARIGVSRGWGGAPVPIAGHDHLADGSVDAAARLASLARPGEVLIAGEICPPAAVAQDRFVCIPQRRSPPLPDPRGEASPLLPVTGYVLALVGEPAHGKHRRAATRGSAGSPP